MVVKYVVVTSIIGGVNDTNRFTAIDAVVVSNWIEARNRVKEAAIRIEEQAIGKLSHEGVKNPESHVFFTKDESRHYHYEVVVDIKDYEWLSQYYDIIELR